MRQSSVLCQCLQGRSGFLGRSTNRRCGCIFTRRTCGPRGASSDQTTFWDASDRNALTAAKERHEVGIRTGWFRLPAQHPHRISYVVKRDAEKDGSDRVSAWWANLLIHEPTKRKRLPWSRPLRVKRISDCAKQGIMTLSGQARRWFASPNTVGRTA
jgi:hypothetical protein